MTLIVVSYISLVLLIASQYVYIKEKRRYRLIYSFISARKRNSNISIYEKFQSVQFLTKKTKEYYISVDGLNLAFIMC
jgi:hypothetical protein